MTSSTLVQENTDLNAYNTKRNFDQYNNTHNEQIKTALQTKRGYEWKLCHGNTAKQSNDSM